MAETVQLFITCITDTLSPEVGEAAVTVLERCGVQVEFPAGQTCCGQPAFNAGMRAHARQMAMHTIKTFERTSGPIVVPSGSCAAMLRLSYLELFAEDPDWLPRVHLLAQRVYEFTEFIVDRLQIGDVGARFPGKITYHSSCHLMRELGIDRQPRLLLSNIREAQIVELPHTEECCGFGGVFSLEHPQISAAMLERKIQNIEDTQAPLVVSCDGGCVTNINGGLHRRGKTERAMHIAEILACR